MAQAKVSASSPDLGTNVGLIDQAFGGEVDVVAGAIAIKEGSVFIGSSGALAMTLAAPVAGLPSAGGDDFKVLRLVALTAHAHTVTTPANKINGGKHVLTFAAVGDVAELVAYQGVWYNSFLGGTPVALT